MKSLLRAVLLAGALPSLASALALETIERFEARGGPIPTDLYETRITLARETSQPDIAFQLLKRKVDETNDPASLRQLIPTAVRACVEAGQQATLHRSLLSAILIALAGALAASADDTFPVIHGSILGTIAETADVATTNPGLGAQRQFLDLTL